MTTLMASETHSGLWPAEACRESFLETAVELGSAIADQQTQLPTGDVGWEVLRMAGLGQAPQPTQIGAHLYDGRSGIGLFFAALERYQPGEGWRDRSLAAIQPTRRVLSKILASKEKRDALNIGIGGVFGVGGLIYSFARTSDLLGDEALLDDARSLCALLTEDRIRSRPCDDFVTGTAGLVSALLVLDTLAPGPLPGGVSPLDLAIRAGEKLLKDRISFEERPRAWVSAPKFPPLAGFSHGAAGIVYSLVRLFRATQDERYLDAAIEGVAFERTTFSEPDQNWLDLRADQSKGARCLNNWCHGAPGVLLGRVATLDTLDDDEVRREIAVALATTEGQPLTNSDHVCCGNMGRAEILFDAGQKLGREDLCTAALRLAEIVRERAKKKATFGWQNLDGFDPSFFSGAAGVGYAYLRLTDPTLPSVLALT